MSAAVVASRAGAVRLEGIAKRFGTALAVDDLSLDVQPGEFVCLLGPSGCGKTTTMRIIAGFVEPDAGRVLINGEDVSRRHPNRRDIGMVYQHYALFPHMTVEDNVAFGLRMRRVPGEAAAERVRRILDLVGLGGLGARRPAQLSGGQQQRVALARAMVIEPTVLLLDEPLSNLDAKLRKRMQVELKTLQRTVGITTIHVTHDQEEALTLADRVAIMHHGRLEQIGAPRDVYARPRNVFVADFLGKANFLEGEVADGGAPGRSWCARTSAISWRMRTGRPCRWARPSRPSCARNGSNSARRRPCRRTTPCPGGSSEWCSAAPPSASRSAWPAGVCSRPTSRAGAPPTAWRWGSSVIAVIPPEALRVLRRGEGGQGDGR